MNHHNRRIILTALVVIASSFFWTLQAFSASAPAKYVVGYATYTARIVPLWLAKEQGFFTKYGIDVDPVFIRGAPTLVAGMAAGSIHIGRTGGSAILAAVSAGQDGFLSFDAKTSGQGSECTNSSRDPLRIKVQGAIHWEELCS